MTRLKSLLSKVAILTLVLGLFATALPVNAAVPTSMKDTLTRLKMGTSATHTLTVTLTETVDSGETIIFDYGTSLFNLVDSSPACSFAIGTTCTAAVTTSTDIVTVTCTSSGGCMGLLTLGTFTGTNPATTGSKTISLSGTGGVTGSFAIAIADDDQVSITATVDPSITFDLDTATTNTNSDTPYTVALGTITTASNGQKVSGTTDSVNYIWADLDTNASAGAVITVLSTNGTSGLLSTSTPADGIASSSGLISNTTERFGICVSSTATTTGTFTEVAPFNDADCTADEQTPIVGTLTTTAAAIVNTTSDPIAGGRVQITVAAGISGTTEAHADYTDTLTFIATGTF